MKRSMKQFLLLILSLSLLVAFTGCGPKEEPASVAEPNEDDAVVEEYGETRIIIDQAGREVEIPTQVDQVFSSGPVGTIFLYTLVPEKMVGWNKPLSDEQLPFILPEYQELPVLGTYRMNKPSSNTEEILKAAPDLIISMGDVEGKYVQDADYIEETLGIPVVMVDGALEKSGDAYRFLGEIVGAEERAQVLAQYCDEHWEMVTEQVKQIPDAERKSVYYAVGIDGLTTTPAGSVNGELIELAGGKNVVDPGMLEQGRYVEVSMEQVLAWNPDVIIIAEEGHDTMQTILAQDEWQLIQAVEAGEVYSIPALPYDWFNRPPSINKMMGLHWLAHLLYPEQVELDLQEATKEFLHLFYQVDVDDATVEQILQGRSEF